jgi:hypothetical protein
MKLIGSTFLVIITLTAAFLFFSKQELSVNNSAEAENKVEQSGVSSNKGVQQENTISDTTPDTQAVVSNEKQQSNISELESQYQHLAKNENYPTLSSRMAVMNKRRPDAHFNASEILAKVAQSEAWKIADAPGDNLNKLTANEVTDGREFIDFDPLKVESLMVGDHLSIAVSALDQVLDMKVESIRTFDSGDIMWKGSIDNVENGSVTITQSESITLASIILSDDDFTLEAHGKDGWIHNSGSLFNIDVNETDAVYPE